MCKKPGRPATPHVRFQTHPENPQEPALTHSSAPSRWFQDERGRADLDLGLRRHAVIVGANDVGKSSILRMLDLTLGCPTASLYQSLFPSDLYDPSNCYW